MKVKKSHMIISLVIATIIASILTIKINVFITFFLSLLTFVFYSFAIEILTNKKLKKLKNSKELLCVCIVVLLELYLLVILTCYNLSDVTNIILISIFLTIGIISALYPLFRSITKIKKEGK